MRLADYVPALQLKQLKAEGVTMTRDFEFGVQRQHTLLEEGEDAAESVQAKPYVRPVEIDFLSVRASGIDNDLIVTC